MKNLIAISGKKQAGKDKIGKMIQDLIYLQKIEDHAKLTKGYSEFKAKGYLTSDYEIKKFAGKLKEILCIVTGCSMQDLENEEFKNSKLPKEWKVIKVIYKNDKTSSILYELFETRKKALNFKDALNKYASNYDIVVDLNYIPTYREAMVQIGTNLFRDKFHPNIWEIALFAEYKPIYREVADIMLVKYPNWIITDVRFHSELAAVKERRGITIRVNRPSKPITVLPSENWRNSTETIESGTILKVYRYEILILSNTGKEILVYPNEIIIQGRHKIQDLQYEHISETALDNAEFDYVIENNGSITELLDKVKTILIKENLIK